MLYRLEKLIGMPIAATDGTLGKIKDVYFDDARWAVRYLVVETGDWLMGRRVLISPISVDSIDWAEHSVRVRLTMQQVRGSPDIDTAMPVSRQHELNFLDYYGYPEYWTGTLLWGATPFPVVPTHTVSRDATVHAGQTPMDQHLRSLKEVMGYSLQATDAAIGSLEDLLVDNGSWALRYVMVDTREWWIGKHVVVPTQWITALDWEKQLVHVDVLRNAVQQAPEFDPALALSRDYESALFGHYQRPGYWH